MNANTLHLRDLQTVIDETGMSRERILELRAMPEPQGNASYRLLDDWMHANALDPAVSLEFCRRILERLGPKTTHRRHDTSTGPIEGIGGGLTLEKLRTGFGPCQRCDEQGLLRLVGGRWLCPEHARRQESRDRLRRTVKAA